jgi:hypothetical protein
MLISVGLGRTDRRRSSRAALGCLSMPIRVFSRSAHVAGLVTSRQTFVRRRHRWQFAPYSGPQSAAKATGSGTSSNSAEVASALEISGRQRGVLRGSDRSQRVLAAGRLEREDFFDEDGAERERTAVQGHRRQAHPTGRVPRPARNFACSSSTGFRLRFCFIDYRLM